MRPVFILLLLVFNFSSFAQKEMISNDDRMILIRGVNIIPMDKETVITNQDVLVHQGIIIKIKKSGKIKPDQNTLVIEAKGKYLMPGPAEMQAHVPPNDNQKDIERNLNLFLLHG